jgi:hypothetical protein
VACVVSVAEEHTALMIEAVCSFETTTTQPTITQCQHIKAESSLTMNHSEKLKSFYFHSF